MKNFNELGLDKNLSRIFGESGFNELTEIQEKVIPLAVAGKDVIAQSATGSGKTLAFGFPIIEKIKIKGGLQALILTPTRDLAEQISKSFKAFAKYKPLKIITVYGGVSLSPQIEDLQKAEIAIGTPGRILDHISRKTINLSKIKILILDEADRMLDMGFIHEVTDIIYRCPKNRQTLLFSATISNDIMKIAGKYMINPVEVSAESYVDPAKLKQVFYDIPQKEKFSLLVHLIKNENSKLAMVFCNTKRTADLIGDNLGRYGLDVLILHGGLNQSQRKRVLEHFHRSEKFILVCTDVAARGLDIKNVSHIYNYDTPKISNDYIHRIGRTARAGKEGKAITLLSDRDYENFRRINNNSSFNIEQLELPKFEMFFVKVSEQKRSMNFRRGDRDRRMPGQKRNFEKRDDSNQKRSFGKRNFKRNDKKNEDREEKRFVRGKSRERGNPRRDSRRRNIPNHRRTFGRGRFN